MTTQDLADRLTTRLTNLVSLATSPRTPYDDVEVLIASVDFNVRAIMADVGYYMIGREGK